MRPFGDRCKILIHALTFDCSKKYLIKKHKQKRGGRKWKWDNRKKKLDSRKQVNKFQHTCNKPLKANLKYSVRKTKKELMQCTSDFLGGKKK